MVKIQLVIILGLLLNTDGNYRRPFSPYKRSLRNLPPSVIFSNPWSLSSSEENNGKPYSSWELSMLSQIMIDIAVSRCHQILPGQVQNFRKYVELAVEQAPPHGAVGTGFMKMWKDLLECFRLSVESSNRKRDGVEIHKHVDFNAPVQQTQHNNNKGSGGSSNNSDSSAIPQVEDAVNPPPNPSTIIFSPSEKSQHKFKNRKTKGVFYTVGHLFTKLYNNTASIFSSIFGKKRGSSREQGNNSTGDETSSDLNHEEMATEKQFYAKSRSSYTKQVFNRDQHQSIGSWEWSGPSAFEKRTRQRNKKSEKIRTRNFMKNGGKHFRAVFKSLLQVVTRTCPVLEGHDAMMRSVLTEILLYLKEDFERRAEKGGEERDKFSLNFPMQRKLRQCGEVVGEAVS